jgi:hypothetical protein
MFVLVSFDPKSNTTNVVFTSSSKDTLQKICDEFNANIDGKPVFSMPEKIVFAGNVLFKNSFLRCYESQNPLLKISFAKDSYLAIHEVPNV